MSEQEKSFLAEFRKTVLRWSIGTVGSLIIALVIFVFSTTSGMQTLKEKQVEMIQCQDKHEEALINLNLRKVERVEHKEDLKEIKDALIRIEYKIDRRQ
ncbi:MAG: hypothetical protein EOM23_11425 [Candidatus Moranbacteria bacterium]|nr:hypothetical protein [Candidatus Moranbacteria bacterium]